MLAGVNLFTRAVATDIARLKQRMAVATLCYAIAGLAFAAAFGLGGAATIIVMVERYGTVASLAIAAAVLAIIGGLALAANAILRMRQRRLKRHAAALRSAAIADTAAIGATKAQNVTPALLPVAAVIAFALTNSFLKPSSRDS